MSPVDNYSRPYIFFKLFDKGGVLGGCKSVFEVEVIVKYIAI